MNDYPEVLPGIRARTLPRGTGHTSTDGQFWHRGKLENCGPCSAPSVLAARPESDQR